MQKSIKTIKFFIVALNIGSFLSGCDVNPSQRQSYFDTGKNPVIWQQKDNQQFYACKDKSKCPNSNLKEKAND
ncbi:MAG: hypothetical protein CMF49_08230 [Legionellales bacterium]|mgnify:CR=1 FL=1|nr:hypothetical protein [Legionellales bacterium]|tara:strand:- start:1393 stop:1611 length:219 start_codon:yes stop_codon:yes gene_type:complete